MVPVLLLLSQLSLSPTKVVTLTTPDGEASCFVELPASGRVRMFQPHAASVWLLQKSERLVLTEGTSRVSVYDDTTKRWSEREYVVRRERDIKALKREVPRACVAVESRETMEKPMLAPPYCEAKWTAEGEHELEVPVGESCTVTIDGITRVVVGRMRPGFCRRPPSERSSTSSRGRASQHSAADKPSPSASRSDAVGLVSAVGRPVNVRAPRREAECPSTAQPTSRRLPRRGLTQSAWFLPSAVQGAEYAASPSS